jgi:hypothetical protein
MKKYKCIFLGIFVFVGGVSFFSPITHAQSPWANAIRFAGTDGYIMVPDNPSLRIKDSVTIAARVKRTRLDGIDFILEKGGDWNIGETNYGISLHGNYNNHMFYFIFHGGWRGTSGVADTNWHHYAVVARNGDANPTFFIDGALRPTEFSEGAPVIYMDYTSLRTLNIGGQLESGATHYSANIIDELSIWTGVRDSLQIRTIMMDTLGSAYYATADSGLVGYWRFDEFEDLGINGDGSDDVQDLSHTSAHGDAVGTLALVPSGSVTGVREETTEMPKGFALKQNYPNPFNPTTIISFSLPTRSPISLKVLDILGREVATLVHEELPAGNHSRQWNASGMSSGIYYYRIQAGTYIGTKKLLLLR